MISEIYEYDGHKWDIQEKEENWGYKKYNHILLCSGCRTRVSTEQEPYKCMKCGEKSSYNEGSLKKVKLELDILKSSSDYENADVIRLDGALTTIFREKIEDTDYRIDTKISKNPKGGKQVMIMVGSKKDSDKTQLFLDIENEKMSFDQNNYHPKEMFVKVVAIFKESKSSIEDNRF